MTASTIARAATPAGPAAPAEAARLGLHLKHLGLDVRPLPRIETAEPARARSTIDARRGPVIFRGLTQHWRAHTAWAPEALARAHGHQMVTALMDLPARGVLFPRHQDFYLRRLPFAEFLARTLAATPEAPCYLAYTRPEELLPATDYDFSPILDGRLEGSDTRVWIGSAGTRSMLHSDLKDNLLCQIRGEKHVVLLPWRYSRAAYPFPDNLVNSQVDLGDLDLARFPRLRSAVLYAGTLEPGDVLYMPRGCWHDLRSTSPSVSLNCWFGPPLGVRDYAPLLLSLGPRHWMATALDLLRYALLGRRAPTRFFFSPPSTGERLYDALRWGDFSRGNDPALESPRGGRRSPEGPPPDST